MRTLSIHRLVQAVLHDSMSQKMSLLWSERAIRCCQRSFPEVEFAHWMECELYLPHALICFHQIEQEQMVFPEQYNCSIKQVYILTERAQIYPS